MGSPQMVWSTNIGEKHEIRETESWREETGISHMTVYVSKKMKPTEELFVTASNQGQLLFYGTVWK